MFVGVALPLYAHRFEYLAVPASTLPARAGNHGVALCCYFGKQSESLHVLKITSHHLAFPV